jgi:archaeal flagellin FlaB
MFKKVRKLFKDESGLSALETAIILIAFVVVAAIFAFTMLSAGMFSTERSKEAVYAGLSEVRGSMELRGSLIGIAGTTGVTGTVDSVVFTVGNVAGGEPIDLTDTTGSNKVVMDYRDDAQRETNLPWTLTWSVQQDSDNLLEPGELAEITVDLSGLDSSLGINTLFAVEIKPPQGGVIVLERTTPAYIDSVMDLH